MRDQRVGVLPARDHDDQARDDHADRAEQVGEHVEERGLHVQALRSRAREDPGGGDVDGEARDADGEHPAARAPRAGRSSRPIAATKIQIETATSATPFDQRGEDLRTAGSRSSAAASPAWTRATSREERQPERAGVREHVRRVGEHGERVGDQADRDLDDREARDQHERRAESPPVSARRGASRPWAWPGCACMKVRLSVADDENHFGGRPSKLTANGERLRAALDHCPGRGGVESARRASGAG